MKKLYIIILLNILFLASFSQSINLTWAEGIGGSFFDDARGITHDKLGNVYITGGFQGTVDFDPGPGTSTLTGNAKTYIAKYNSNGNLIWAKCMGGANNAVGNGIFVDYNGNVYTTGHFRGPSADFDPGPSVYNLPSFGADNCFISKLDINGNFVWAKSIISTNSLPNVSDGFSLAVDSLENIIVVGYFNGSMDFDPGPSTYTLSSAGGYDLFTLKLDSIGNFKWVNRIGDIKDEKASFVVLDSTGNCYVTGNFQETVDFDPGINTFTLSAPATTNVFILKLDTLGNFIFADQIGGDIGNCITLDSSGNIYVTGNFIGNRDFDPSPFTNSILSSFGSADLFLCKLDGFGNFLWAKQMGGSSSTCQGTSLCIDALNNICLSGWFRGSIDADPGPGTNSITTLVNDDSFISKLDANGNYIWAGKNNGTGGDYCLSITLDISGNLYTCGSFSGTCDFDPTVSTFTLGTFGATDLFIQKLCTNCSITDMKDLNDTKNITSFPNPTNNFINIHTNESSFQSTKLEILNSLGQTVLKSEFKNQIDVSQLANGFYTLLLKDNSGSVIIKKFVKE